MDTSCKMHVQDTKQPTTLVFILKMVCGLLAPLAYVLPMLVLSLHPHTSDILKGVQACYSVLLKLRVLSGK